MRQKRTSVKALPETLDQLKLLKDGGRFPSVQAVVAHLAKIGAAHPELLREGRS